MENDPKKPTPGPLINPYVFTVLLLAFGLWCFWDGWIARDTGMKDYAVTMNRVASLILIPWAIWDFFKLRRQASRDSDPPSASKGG